MLWSISKAAEHCLQNAAAFCQRTLLACALEGGGPALLFKSPIFSVIFHYIYDEVESMFFGSFENK